MGRLCGIQTIESASPRTWARCEHSPLLLAAGPLLFGRGVPVTHESGPEAQLHTMRPLSTIPQGRARTPIQLSF